MNSKKHTLSRKVLATLITAAMLITMLPSAMFAEEQSNVQSSEITFQMDNLMVKTNQATKLSYSTSVDESQINFQVENDVAEVYKSNDVWYVRAKKQGIEPGTSDTIHAYYNESEIGTCKIIFVSPMEITYTSNGEELSNYQTYKIPFAVSTTIQAQIDVNASSLSSANVSGWKWKLDIDPSKGECIANANDSSQANVIFYQNVSSASLSAVPLISYEGEEYLYNYASSRTLSSNYVEDGTTSIVSATSPAIYQGSSTTLTFNLPDSLKNDDVSVNWSSSNEQIVPSPEEKGFTVTVTPPLYAPIESSYETVTLTASVTIDGHTYVGSTALFIYKVTVSAQGQASDWASFENLLSSESVTTIDVIQTIEIPENTTIDLSKKEILRPTNCNQSLFKVSGKDVVIESDGTGVINGQYGGAQAPLISVTDSGTLKLNNIKLKNNINSGSSTESQGGAISVNGGSLTCENVTFENNTARGNVISPQSSREGK